MLKKIKNDRAITLITLIITIILLIILTGVIINVSLGKNGIFRRVKEAKERTEYESAVEILEMKITDANMELINRNRRLAILEELEYYFKNDEEIQVELIKYENIAYLGENVQRTEKIKGFWVKVVKYYKYSFLIGEEGKIEAISLDNGTTKMALEEYNKLIGIERKNRRYKNKCKQHKWNIFYSNSRYKQLKRKNSTI